jgi:hypothetical protein
MLCVVSPFTLTLASTLGASAQWSDRRGCRFGLFISLHFTRFLFAASSKARSTRLEGTCLFVGGLNVPAVWEPSGPFHSRQTVCTRRPLEGEFHLRIIVWEIGLKAHLFVICDEDL